MLKTRHILLAGTILTTLPALMLPAEAGPAGSMVIAQAAQPAPAGDEVGPDGTPRRREPGTRPARPDGRPAQPPGAQQPAPARPSAQEPAQRQAPAAQERPTPPAAQTPPPPPAASGRQAPPAAVQERREERQQRREERPSAQEPTQRQAPATQERAAPPAASGKQAPPPAAQERPAQPPAAQTPPAQPQAPAASGKQAPPPAAQERSAQPPAVQTQPGQPPAPAASGKQAPPPAAQERSAQPPAAQTQPGQPPAPAASGKQAPPSTAQERPAQAPAAQGQPAQPTAPAAQGQPAQPPAPAASGKQGPQQPATAQDPARPAAPAAQGQPAQPPAATAQDRRPDLPPPVQQETRDSREFLRRDGQGPALRIENLREQRREVRQGDTVYIREPDRTIIREGNRTIIRHNEVDRFRVDARNVRTERRGDETTTIVERPDGARIVTVTDEDGRLIRRVRRDPRGQDIVIIDNSRTSPRGGRSFSEEVYVDLPPPQVRIPRERYIVEAEGASDEVIYETLTAQPVERIDRRYTLDQVRYSSDLRERMPRIDLDAITFETGSWQLAPEQIEKLATIATGMKRAIERNPREVFLIEGHTDAIGPDVDNLSLSDRRAESVAVALTERFQVPAENLTTQGYGEQYLKVNTQEAERQNRRVTARRITPLMTGDAGNKQGSR